MDATRPRPEGIHLQDHERLIWAEKMGAWLIVEKPGRRGYDKHEWRFARPEDEALYRARTAARLRREINELVAGARWAFRQARGIGGLNRLSAGFYAEGFNKLYLARRRRAGLIPLLPYLERAAA